MLRNDKHIIVVRHLKKKKKKRFKEKNRLVQKTSVRLSVALPEVILKAFIVPNFETLHILLEYQSQRHRIPRSNRLHFEKPPKNGILTWKSLFHTQNKRRACGLLRRESEHGRSSGPSF